MSLHMENTHKASLSHTLGFKLKNVLLVQCSPTTSPVIGPNSAIITPGSIQNVLKKTSSIPQRQRSAKTGSSIDTSKHRKSLSYLISGFTSITNTPKAGSLIMNNTKTMDSNAEKFQLSLIPAHNPPIVNDHLEHLVMNNLRQEDKNSRCGVRIYKKSVSISNSATLKSPNGIVRVSLNNFGRVPTPQSSQQILSSPLKCGLKSNDEQNLKAKTGDNQQEAKILYSVGLSSKEFIVNKLDNGKEDLKSAQYSLFHNNPSYNSSKTDFFSPNQTQLNQNMQDQVHESKQSKRDENQGRYKEEDSPKEKMNHNDRDSKVILKRLLKLDERLSGGVRVYFRSLQRKDRRPERELSSESGYTLGDRQRVIIEAKKNKSNKKSLDMKELKCFQDLKESTRLGSPKKVNITSHRGLEKTKNNEGEDGALGTLKGFCRDVTNYNEGFVFE